MGPPGSHSGSRLGVGTADLPKRDACYGRSRPRAGSASCEVRRPDQQPGFEGCGRLSVEFVPVSQILIFLTAQECRETRRREQENLRDDLKRCRIGCLPELTCDQQRWRASDKLHCTGSYYGQQKLMDCQSASAEKVAQRINLRDQRACQREAEAARTEEKVHDLLTSCGPSGNLFLYALHLGLLSTSNNFSNPSVKAKLLHVP